MNTRSVLQARYDFLTTYLIANGMLTRNDNGTWVLKKVPSINKNQAEGTDIDATIDDAVQKLEEIKAKWLTPEQQRIEQNQSTALYVDSLIAGSNG